MDNLYEFLFNKVVPSTESQPPSPEQVESIILKTLNAYERQGSHQAERLYRELDSDPAIAGVGTSREPGDRPERIVTKSEFRERYTRSDMYGYDVLPGTPRIRTEIETLTLISPVLLDKKRKWKFLGKEGEFGAYIKDGAFLDSMIRGDSIIPMVAGIQLEVELQSLDVFTGGAWVTRERNVLRVRRVIPPVVQLHLGSLSKPP